MNTSCKHPLTRRSGPFYKHNQEEGENLFSFWTHPHCLLSFLARKAIEVKESEKANISRKLFQVNKYLTQEDMALKQITI